MLQENIKRPESDRYNMAIKSIEYDKGKKFDPNILDRVADALKLAFGGYYR